VNALAVTEKSASVGAEAETKAFHVHLALLEPSVSIKERAHIYLAVANFAQVNYSKDLLALATAGTVIPWENSTPTASKEAHIFIP